MDKSLENRLQRLIEGNSEANRYKWAEEWKKQGKKVIGVMSSYVPEEVIYAAGMLPWRITGTWKENVTLAGAYRTPSSTCPYSTHVLESFLHGELDFLDGLVIADQDQDVLRTYEVLVYLKKLPFSFALHMPYTNTSLSRRYYTGEIRRLISGFEDYWGMKISKESLRSSIDTYNEMRSLLSQLYELRKKEIPPLTGAEVLGITTTAQVMPRQEFNQELKDLLPYLEERKTNHKPVHPRLLVESEKLDNPAYLELVEENCLVAMDDMDTGIRYFIQTVDTTVEDLSYNLAERYLSRHGSARFYDWDEQLEQIIKWVVDFKIDGVLSLAHKYEVPQRYRMPFLHEKLEEKGIPHIVLEREYPLANLGQLRTRVGAFLEMISAKEESRL
ncbi:2-hydroxyacyl-CoA dehydratase subunit D [Chloroflexota bacterium]